MRWDVKVRYLEVRDSEFGVMAVEKCCSERCVGRKEGARNDEVVSEMEDTESLRYRTSGYRWRYYWRRWSWNYQSGEKRSFVEGASIRPCVSFCGL